MRGWIVSTAWSITSDSSTAAADAGGVEQVVQQVRHVVDLAPDHPGQVQQLGRGVGDALEQRGGHADRRERVAQLMGQHCEEFVLAPVGGLGVVARTLGTDGGQHQVLVGFAQLGDHLLERGLVAGDPAQHFHFILERANAAQQQLLRQAADRLPGAPFVKETLL
jgi:hypothetical protein